MNGKSECVSFESRTFLTESANDCKFFLSKKMEKLCERSTIDL